MHGSVSAKHLSLLDVTSQEDVTGEEHQQQGTTSSGKTVSEMRRSRSLPSVFLPEDVEQSQALYKSAKERDVAKKVLPPEVVEGRYLLSHCVALGAAHTDLLVEAFVDSFKPKELEAFAKYLKVSQGALDHIRAYTMTPKQAQKFGVKS